MEYEALVPQFACGLRLVMEKVEDRKISAGKGVKIIILREIQQDLDVSHM